MARFERLLIPIILIVIIAAFLLEGVGPSGVRAVALTIGALLAFAMVVGMIHRARRKGRSNPPAPPGQTSNDGPQPPA